MIFQTGSFDIRHRRQKTERGGFPGCGWSLRQLVGQQSLWVAYYPILTVVLHWNHIFRSSLPDVQKVLPVSHNQSQAAARLVAQWEYVSLCSPICINNTPTTSRHVDVVFYADDRGTSRNPSFRRLEDCVWNWKMAVNFSTSSSVSVAKTAKPIQKPIPVHFFRQPIKRVETERHILPIIYTQLTWMAQVSPVERKADQRQGVLGPL
jgi:hypothetical protein